MTDAAPDPRSRQLVEARLRIAHEPYGSAPDFGRLSRAEQKLFLREASTWLRAAVAAGIAPAAARPTDDHDAVYVDEEGSRIWLSGGEPEATPHGADKVVLPPDTDGRPLADGGIVRPGRTEHEREDGITCTVPPTSTDAVGPGADVRPRSGTDEGRIPVRRATDTAFLGVDEDQEQSASRSDSTSPLCRSGLDAHAEPAR
ncbi:hypothetical protein JHN59_37065 [Streptomyces sp. MBT49]|uniref:hypothetical protein n=1 Tax=unclassified Streptomyces TaxID=2593676 RepID=UPI00190DC69B|nr:MULTISPECIES: hypothetical protein [unclassified Streptomyces]MBK3630312.1 hypothetical protein [Streptomyces sp. MBT49]MBK3634699.1 hypothetical protein [Streptomyces sp. MBT97]